MQTIKTSVVVVLLLAVLYGAYTVINQPPPKLPPEVADMTTDMWDDNVGVAVEMAPESESGITAFDAANQSSPPPQPGLLPADSLGGPPPSQSVETIDAGPTADAAMNQQAAAMLAAPQPLSPVDAMESASQGSPAGDTSSIPAATGTQPATAMTTNQDAVADLPQPPTGIEQASATPPLGNDTPVGAATSTPTEQNSVVLAKTFPKDWTRANALLGERKFKDALQLLTPHFGSADLTAEESEQLIGILDPLAGKVIYSREHLVTSPHRIRRGETLYSIADQYQVPWQLLQNINGITNPEVLVPTTEIKVLRGPFSAQVDVRRSELTLFIDGMYAGRFPISIGSDFAAGAGEYQVQGKSTERTYYGPNNVVLPAGHPENPYGNAWLHLGGELAIHGSPKNVPRGTTAAGAISLSPRDAQDIYGILSKGSKVTILR